MKSSFSSLGILTALAASLCCITPFLAVVAGFSGLTTTFSWLEPARPWFTGLTILILGFAWYSQIMGPKDDSGNCDCDTGPRNMKFLHSKTFLGMVTITAALLLSFPQYSHIFFPEVEKSTLVPVSDQMEKMEIWIEGMTCTGCERQIESEVAKVDGIFSVKASFEEGNAVVVFDPGQSSLETIVDAVNSTGYMVEGVGKITEESKWKEHEQD